jgi:hypothetical protein
VQYLPGRVTAKGKDIINPAPTAGKDQVVLYALSFAGKSCFIPTSERFIVFSRCKKQVPA